MSLFSVIKKGFKKITKPIVKVTGNKFVQAAVPVLAVNSHVTVSTARGGPKAGFKAAEAALKNPVTRRAAAATAMVFPAALPVVAAQEVAIRALDAAKSRNPRVAAGALMQIAATTALAKSGNPDARRALSVFKGVGKAKTLLRAAAKATGSTKTRLEAQVARSPAAQLLYLRTLERSTTSKNPKLRAAATRARNALLQVPGGRQALAGIQAGRLASTAVMVRQFSVSKQGRVFKQGRLLRSR